MDFMHPKLSENNLFLEHGYGNKVHLVDNLLAQTMLAKFSQQDCLLPELNYFLRDLYKVLLNTTIKKFF